MFGKKIVIFVWQLLLRVFGAVVGITVVLLVVALFRIAGYEQEHNKTKLASKLTYLSSIAAMQANTAARPNIVFILYDDMGYGDIGYGASANSMINTPHLDQLAANGVVLSNFYSPAPVCTPSRAGYMTGRLPVRAGMPNVVFPSESRETLALKLFAGRNASLQLPAEEITLADLLQAAGYATGMVGKWHLGDRSPSLPNEMGFDSFYGALYSNDMEPFAFYRDRQVALPAPVDQTQMTELYTGEAVRFIEAHARENFFLYFAHNFPHDPLSVRKSRSGQSNAGLFGDVVEEIDDGVGEIVDALTRTGNLNNTLIIVSSDNGPWYLGDPGNQRGRKGNTFDGGMRVPFIAHWPAALSGGRVEHAMAMGIDLLPTVLDILNLPHPVDRILDGKSVWDVLDAGESTAHDYLYYYDGETLFAARDTRYKYRGSAGVFYSTDQMPIGTSFTQKEWLFDLAGDPRESYDTSDRYPQVLDRMRAAFAEKKREMVENKRGWVSP